MEVSVIIPTYGRPNDLEDCLNSILQQSVHPKEILIVDDTSNDSVEKVFHQKVKPFKELSISIKYIRTHKEPSITIARNVGIKHSTGDIVLFLDDDVILRETYLAEILKVYRTSPNVLGVQGYIENYSAPTRITLKQSICRVFYLMHFESNRNCLLPSIQNVYAGPLTRIINCQWLVGNNCSYKQQLLKKFKFNEKLKRFSSGDDVEFSYRVYQRSPNGLFQTPFAKLIHKTSNESRLPDKKLTYIGQVYHTHIFYQLFNTRVRNKFIFLWSRVGYCLITFKSLLLSPTRKARLKVKNLIKAYIFCLKHLPKIKQGDLTFFDEILKE